ncbi:hypothetical protein SFHH103_04139 (plasmid) [Sinorhizobium fredii HH103]|uniref:Uncharacterized protein n=1 Tax=Sinorhizobium fredii (strain HH103) TaxID=1117943 RepID=G9AC50_SINF1|nr:hypothetical protein SFHH103_04139 [Sinorhizobium fredii HH103]
MLKASNAITLQRVQHWNESGLPGDKSSLGCRRAAPVRAAHPVTVMSARNHRPAHRVYPAAAGSRPFAAIRLHAECFTLVGGLATACPIFVAGLPPRVCSATVRLREDRRSVEAVDHNRLSRGCRSPRR